MAPDVPSSPLPPAFDEGIVLFNREEFYEAHEVWEDLWTVEKSDRAHFYQGLIHYAGGFLHGLAGRWDPAVKMFNSAREKLAPFEPAHGGIDVAAIRVRCGEALGALAGIQRQKGGTFPRELIPKLARTSGA